MPESSEITFHFNDHQSAVMPLLTLDSMRVFRCEDMQPFLKDLFSTGKTYHFIERLRGARHRDKYLRDNTYYYCPFTEGQIEGMQYLPEVMWQSWKSNQGQADFRACVMKCHPMASSTFIFL